MQETPLDRGHLREVAYTSLLRKRHKLDNRHCEIMFVENQPSGFMIYKKTLQQEFGIKNSFELKTLFVFKPEENTRRGLGFVVSWSRCVGTHAESHLH
jgi:hypothetical protein